jgi:hypothetical protein
MKFKLLVAYLLDIKNKDDMEKFKSKIKKQFDELNDDEKIRVRYFINIVKNIVDK